MTTENYPEENVFLHLIGGAKKKESIYLRFSLKGVYKPT